MESNYAIMQPYFFPYVGYFSLIKNSDHWIVFDEISFMRKSWGSRNRMLQSSDETQWIHAPTIKQPRGTNYSDIMIRNDEDWKTKILSQLHFYRSKAPYYGEVTKLLNDIFGPEFERLSEFNVYAMFKVCEYLGIEFNHTMYSDLDLGIESVDYSGEWALRIMEKIGESKYTNMMSGHFLFHEKDWKDSNIELNFLDNEINEYKQHGEFVSNLSILDVMMWNSIESTNRIVDDYNILKASEV